MLDGERWLALNLAHGQIHKPEMGDDGVPPLPSMCPVVIVVTRYQTDYLSSMGMKNTDKRTISTIE